MAHASEPLQRSNPNLLPHTLPGSLCGHVEYVTCLSQQDHLELLFFTVC